MKLHNNALDVCESAQTACNRALAPIVRVNKPQRGRVNEPMVGQCLRRRANIDPTLVQRLVFAGSLSAEHTHCRKGN